jgi:starch synthase (maltosyl-transferring)
MAPTHGRNRVVIRRLRPELAAGDFTIARVRGEELRVQADAFADGHDVVVMRLRYRRRPRTAGRDTREEAPEWTELPMAPLGNDSFEAAFTPDALGFYEYSAVGWIDHFATWQQGLARKVEAGVADEVDLEIGGSLVAGGAERAREMRAPADPTRLDELAALLGDPAQPWKKRLEAAQSAELGSLMAAVPDRRFETLYPRVITLRVDRERAGFSAWYEFFPRSTSGSATEHGTFRTARRRLDYIASLGFDVAYLPPIHPIGRVKRKGRNNALTAGPKDPGSPWAIGSEEGGHTAVHPDLGTEEDFRALVEHARELRMEIALDIAFQCAPDHPWVTEHPDWFVHRPDGSVQFAENPPKKYEDIYPINFETDDWENLWETLADVFRRWISLGVKIFRVDNPHTKAYPFWRWLIPTLQEEDPELIFLAEAFTRPKRMYELAGLGYTHSYTYFTWRNSPGEMRAYLEELTQTDVAEYFRPNFWPNTPDILHEDLQLGGTAAFKARFLLAATLSSNYGIYGPAFELQEASPREPGSEEYLHSEKYEIREWDLDAAESLAPFIRKINRIRWENPALQRTRNLTFHNADNPNLLCYSKRSAEDVNIVLIVVNMDYHNTQAGMVEFSPAALGLPFEGPFVLHDLITDSSYTWHDYWNFVMLDPAAEPAHILRVERL